MNEQLAITALGKDRPGIVNELSDAITANQLNIEDSRMSVLGGEFAILMLASGSSQSIEEFMALTGKLEDKLGMRLLVKPTSKEQESLPLALYDVEVVSIDHPGIVRDIANFFSARHINIVDLDTSRYPAAHTGTLMFAVLMTIGVPEKQPIAELSDEFISLCDELNLDAKITEALQY